MELHLIIEILCSFLGLLLYTSTKKSLLIQNTLVGLFGLFLFITGLAHISIATFAEHYPIIDVNIASPITWFLPAALTPLWVRAISKKMTRMSPLIIAMSLIGVIATIVALVMLQNYYWVGYIVGRPIEFIIVFFALMSLIKVYNVNGSGKPLSLILILLMLSHSVMSFSTAMYDIMFTISHTIKLCWYIALFLLIKESSNVVECDTDKLILELDKRLK